MSNEPRWILLAIVLAAGLVAGCASPDESGDDANNNDSVGDVNDTNDTGMPGFDSTMDNDWGEQDEAGNATTSG